MKKTLVLVLSIMLLFAFASCNNNSIPGGYPGLIGPGTFPGGSSSPETFNVSTLAALKSAVTNADDGDKIVLNDLPVDLNKDSSELPVVIDKDISVSGNIVLNDSTSTEQVTKVSISSVDDSVPVEQNLLSIFKIQDSAVVTFNGFNADVSSDVAVKISSLVTIDSGKADVQSFDVTGTGEESVTAFMLGTNATADSIAISSGVNISVDAENDEVLEEVIEKNPFVSTKYDDIDFTGILSSEDDITDFTIDLNNYKLTLNLSDTFYIKDKTKFDIENGKLDIKINNAGTDKTFISVGIGSTLNMIGVIYNSDQTAILVAQNDATLNVSGSEIYGNYGFAISTNASIPPSNVTITINEESKIISPKGPGILFNLPSSKLTIDNSYIEGSAQAVIVRGGKAVISNSELIATGNDDDPSSYEKYLNNSWGTGSSVPFAALVVGDRNSSSYNYGLVECEAMNVDIKCEKDGGALVYISSDDASDGSDIDFTSTSLTIDKEYEAAIKESAGHYKGNSTTLTLNSQEIEE